MYKNIIRARKIMPRKHLFLSPDFFPVELSGKDDMLLKSCCKVTCISICYLITLKRPQHIHTYS